jgi:hypothetical protein
MRSSVATVLPRPQLTKRALSWTGGEISMRGEKQNGKRRMVNLHRNELFPSDKLVRGLAARKHCKVRRRES